jgi:hypothetical protein
VSITFESIRVVLQSLSVKLLDRYRLEVYSIQATNVDRSDRLTVGIDSFGIRMNATDSAKTMTDYMFVKLIGADVSIRRVDGQLRARHEPQKRSFARTDRAITGQRFVDETFDFESDVAAMAASSIFHLRSPRLL